MFCGGCGQAIQDDDQFCRACGRPATDEETPLAEPTPSTSRWPVWVGLVALGLIAGGLVTWLAVGGSDDDTPVATDADPATTATPAPTTTAAPTTTTTVDPDDAWDEIEDDLPTGTLVSPDLETAEGPVRLTIDDTRITVWRFDAGWDTIAKPRLTAAPITFVDRSDPFIIADLTGDGSDDVYLSVEGGNQWAGSVITGHGGDWRVADFDYELANGNAIPRLDYDEPADRLFVSERLCQPSCADGGNLEIDFGYDTDTGRFVPTSPTTPPAPEVSAAGALAVDAFAGVPFGAPYADAVAAATTLLGPPVDTGFTPECPPGPQTATWWTGLGLTSYDGGQTLAAWDYRGTTPALTTPSGITTGATVQQLVDTYGPTLAIHETTLGWELSYTIDTTTGPHTLRGIVTGPTAGDTVVSLFSDMTCTFH